jgi:hypothetical protein
MSEELVNTSAPEGAEEQTDTTETPEAAVSTDVSIVDINIDDGTSEGMVEGTTEDDTADDTPEDAEQAAIDKAMSPLSQEELASLDSFNELVPFENETPRTTEFTAEDGNTTYSTREP